MTITEDVQTEGFLKAVLALHKVRELGATFIGGPKLVLTLCFSGRFHSFRHDRRRSSKLIFGLMPATKRFCKAHIR